jgi:phosphatidate cytidylyltransferase
MGAVFFIFMCFFKNFPLDKVMFSTVVMLVVFFMVEVFGKKPDLSMSRISISFIGAFFVPIAFIYMVYLRNFYCGMKLVFFIFIVVWVLDTASYAFGIMFGKHRLASNISPKKTVEGAVVGIIFGVFATVFCKYTFIKDMLTLQNSLILGIVISVVGQFSDLTESLIKRDGGTKNSGKIIPGHGGVFDRFDSYIFVAPAVYYILEIMR